MVMFTCNRCSSALKKSQVETHAFRCGGPSKIDLTCHDCLKDFRGKEYESHTSCITEEARYGGKGVTVKEAGKKQNQWCEVVQNVLANNKTLEPSVYQFLKRAVHMSNIPRKKPQFKNWASNAMKCKDFDLIDKVFDVLIAEFSSIKLTEQPKPEISATDKDQPNSNGGNGLSNETDENEKDVGNKSTKKKKKSKKETDNEKTEEIDDEMNSQKSEPTSDSSLNGVGESQNVKVLKKKKKKNRESKEVTEESVADESVADDGQNRNEKKRKTVSITEEHMELEGSPVVTMDEPAQSDIATEIDDQPNAHKLSKKERKLLKKKAKFEAELAEIESVKKVEEREEEAVVEEEKPKKSKKRKNGVVDDAEGQKEDGAKKRKVETEELEAEVPPKEEDSPRKVKFDWHATILAVLGKSKNDEVPVKKVTKKVLDEYISQYGDKGIHEKLHAKMNKKLQTCPGIRVLKDKVKLLESDRKKN